MKEYDVVVVGSGASGSFMAYEFTKLNSEKKVCVIDAGRKVKARKCPISEGKVNSCIGCNPCNIMYGFGGAGTLSDGKYNITTNFGGDLHNYIGEDKALKLMEYVDSVLMNFDKGDATLYSTENTGLKSECLKNDLHLLTAKVRHFGTERNREILQKIYDYVKDTVDFEFMTKVISVDFEDGYYFVKTDKNETIKCKYLVLAAGRSGSKWISDTCQEFDVEMKKIGLILGFV